MEHSYKMKPGHAMGRSPNEPALFVVGDGPQTYLWVGNNAEGDMACFGTISGKANLRRIARAIIKALDS